MGIISKGSILGDMSGLVGTVVLSPYRGIEIIKSRPKRKTKGKSSEAQVNQNDLFKMVTKFLSGASSAIKIGYQLPKNTKMSPMNAAVSYHMLHAIVGKSPHQSIDMGKVKFSHPVRSTENGWNAKFVGGQGRYAAVCWELNAFPEKTTCRDDKAVVVFYDETLGEFMIYGDSQRSTLSFIFSNHSSYTGHKLFCWLFFTSADGKLVSETEYLGMIKMMD